jgi:regulatory protein YycH of two-component signal transduction system YycFG
MSKKQIKILIITFIIVLAIVLGVFFLTNGKDNIVNNNEENEKLEIEKINNLNNEIETEVNEEVAIVNKEDAVNLKIKAVAKNFTERYGTWSTDNKDDNFKSAEVYASSRMKNMIENFISDNEKLADDYGDYYGITTKALNVRIINSSDGNANLSVVAQQVATLGENLDQEISYRSLSLELIKDGEDWLVDHAKWED